MAGEPIDTHEHEADTETSPAPMTEDSSVEGTPEGTTPDEGVETSPAEKPKQKEDAPETPEEKPDDESIPNPMADEDDILPEQKTDFSKEEVDKYLADAGLGEDAQDTVYGKNAFGEDLSLTAIEKRAVAPFLQKAGIDPKHAKGVFDAFAMLAAAKAKVQATEDAKIYRTMAEEQKEAFGEDYDRIRKLSISGAKKVFSPAYWKELQAHPVLTCSKEFMGAMAKVGELFATDDGTGGSSTKVKEEEGFSLSRWLNS